MKTIYFVLVFVFCSFLSSCGALWSGGKPELPTNVFSELSNISVLNGTYQNKTNKVLHENAFKSYKGKLSNIFHLPSDSVSFIDYKFDKENVNMVFEIDSILHKKNYKGKLKNNYFEITLKKKIIPIPFIYFIRQIEKVRIGKDKEGNLLIHYWEDYLGWIIIGAAGDTYEDEYTFKKVEN